MSRKTFAERIEQAVQHFSKRDLPAKVSTTDGSLLPGK
jgi:hypothetical protein